MLTWGVYPQESRVGAELFPQGPPDVPGGRRIDRQRFEPMWLQFGLTPKVVIGKTTVRVRCHFDLIDCLAKGDSARIYGTHGGIVASVEFDRMAETTIIDRNLEIKLTWNSSLEAAIRECISVPEQIRPDAEWQSIFENSVLIDKPPVDLAFDVIWRIGELEHYSERLYVRAGEFGRSLRRGGTPSWMSRDVKSIDVILRPSRIAAWEGKLTEVWDGPEIIYEGVPLAWGLSNVTEP